MADKFTVDGVEFMLDPLPVKESLPLAKHVGYVVKPAAGIVLGGATFSWPAINSGLVDAIEAVDNCVPLRDAFAKHCKFFRPSSKTKDGKAKGDWFVVETFLDELFQRKHVRFANWLSQCVHLEYGSFLDVIGQKLKEAMASDSDSPTGANGQSGESPNPTSPADTSKSETTGP